MTDKTLIPTVVRLADRIQTHNTRFKELRLKSNHQNKTYDGRVTEPFCTHANLPNHYSALPKELLHQDETILPISVWQTELRCSSGGESHDNRCRD